MVTQIRPEPIMARLRAGTRAQHEATEAIPFSAAILAGTLPLSSYVAQLAAYVRVHEAVERAVAGEAHPAIGRVWKADMRRVALLRADLAALGCTDAALEDRTRAAANDFAAWVDELDRSEPIGLLGVLYVLEGSTLGGAFLRRHLAEAFSLTDAGLRYYSPYGTHPKRHWVGFSDRMNAIDLNATEVDAVIAAARVTFERVGRILLSVGLASPPQAPVETAA